MPVHPSAGTDLTVSAPPAFSKKTRRPVAGLQGVADAASRYFAIIAASGAPNHGHEVAGNPAINSWQSGAFRQSQNLPCFHFNRKVDHASLV